MTINQASLRKWSTWTLEVKVWKILAALIIVPILVLLFSIVRQQSDILLLVSNEVVTDTADQRIWSGSFVNTNARTLRDVSVTVDFLDSQDRSVGKAEAEAVELTSTSRLDLQAPLPPEAVRLRIYSVQWRMDLTTFDRWVRRISPDALIGPFRQPYEFGYTMVDPRAMER